MVDETRLEEGIGRTSVVVNGAQEREFRTTEGEDLSYEETTNCRLRDETNASMMFGSNQNSAVVRLN